MDKKTKITKLTVDRVDLVKAGANSEALMTIAKSVEEAPAATEGGGKAPTTEELLKSALARIETLEKAADEKEPAEGDKPADDKKEEDMEKKDDKSGGGKHSFDETEDLSKSADPRIVELAKAAQELAVYKAKEKMETIKALPLDADELLYIVSKSDTKVFESLQKISKAFEESVLTPIGSEAAKKVAKSGESAWDKIEKASAEMAAEKKISKSAAMTEVIKANPELYTQYLEEDK